MTTFVVRVAGLLAVYLLVLTSVAAGDVIVGSLVAIGIAASSHSRKAGPPVGWPRWIVAVAGTLLSTAVEVVVGTGRTIRFVLGGSAAPGFVEIPRDGRSRRAVALWGLLTGEAPDEYPVDVDETRDALLVHVLDARDPSAIRARHARTRERWQRRVVE